MEQILNCRLIIGFDFHTSTNWHDITCKIVASLRKRDVVLSCLKKSNILHNIFIQISNIVTFSLVDFNTIFLDAWFI